MPAPPDPSPLATNTPNLALHSKMYAAGDQYGVPGLKALALDKFKIQLTRHWYGLDIRSGTVQLTCGKGLSRIRGSNSHSI